MDQLRPQDAQFLYMESEDNLTHVTSISIFDQTSVPGGATVRFKDILAHLNGRLHMSPLFRRRLVRVPLELDFPYWVDDEHFDLEYHVQHGRLPEPCDWRQFCIHMARYHSRPLDMNRPLWEMLVVEGLDNIDWLPKRSYAIATKIHHAAVDGTAIINFFGAMMDINNTGTPAVPLDATTATASPRPGVIDIAGRALWHTIRSPIGMTDAIMRATPSLYHVAQNALRSKGDDDKHSVPKTRFNGSVSPHKMFDATTLSLDEIKAVRPAVPGCTINDIVLCICGGGLRKYLEKHRELPDESLVAWVPINARSSRGSATDAPGNNVTSMTTPIFTDVEDPIERLRCIHKSTEQSKEAKAGISARLMVDLSKHVPAATQVMASRLVLRTGMKQRVCNLFVSNVPGPQVPLYMNGALQVGSFGMAPLADGMGLFIATPSYNGKVSFGVTSTREILPDIRFFVTCLEEAMNDLKRAAKPAKKAGAKKKKSKKRAAKSKPQPKTNGERPAV